VYLGLEGVENSNVPNIENSARKEVSALPESLEDDHLVLVSMTSG
jgi:hypothetical protein